MRAVMDAIMDVVRILLIIIIPFLFAFISYHYQRRIHELGLNWKWKLLIFIVCIAVYFQLIYPLMFGS